MIGVSEEARAGRKPSARAARLLLGVLVVAMAAAALAVVTIKIKAPPSPTGQSKKTTYAGTDGQSPRPPAFADDVSLPPPAPPPPLTTAEIKKPAPETTSPPPAAADNSTSGTAAAGDPGSLPMEELRKQAAANDVPSMIETGRRLILGIGIAKDPQAGAGWMLRAAELGSPQAAFNVGVMYESGFVVERDSTKAAQWYRRAADAGLPAAEHNLALMLRTGKGVARDQAQAVKLLLAAAHQGMTAAMFTLGDIYERGDAAPKDFAAATAWFAVTAQFERQANNGDDTPLAKAALQRSQALQRVLTPADLQRAQELGRREIEKIIAGTSSAAQSAQMPAPALPPPAPDSAAPKPQDAAAGWPAATIDQVRAVQQALFDLKLLRDKPDGLPGPMTRAAIRDFQRSAGLAETGEPTKDVYVALKQALTKRDPTASAPAGSATQAPKSTKP